VLSMHLVRRLPGRPNHAIERHRIAGVTDVADYRVCIGISYYIDIRILPKNAGLAFFSGTPYAVPVKAESPPIR
jgi:hypothetical protein